ncbi:hypothetical protein V492_00506 [Pseudogymnoascus sp. VKM F-4246]|nr:hypothetical protein V492_00506 [Pseudogymnoascus sp. VKM F-4246]
MPLSREDVADIFREAEARKLNYLAKAILNQDGYLDDNWLQGQCTYAGYSIVNTTYQILLEIPEAVKLGLIRGDLPEIEQHTDVRALQRPSYVAAVPLAPLPIHPSIYAIYIVDKTTKKPPTVADLDKIITRVRVLSNNPAVLALATNLAARIQGYSPQTTLAGGLVDVGFSKDSAARLIQHHQGINTNDVMAKFKTAADDVCGRGKYVLYGYIVCRLRKFSFCALGEVIISRLAQSYTSRGGGFNGAIAGANMHGAWTLNPIEWEQIEAAPPTPYYTANLAADRERIQALRDLNGRVERVVMQRSIQNILIEMLPRETRERIRASEQAIRDRFAEAQADTQSQQDNAEDATAQSPQADSPVASTASSPAAAPANSPAQPVANYSSDIDTSSSPVRGRPNPRSRGNHDDDDDEDPIEDDSNPNYRY